jgi:hypothetical protein
MIDSIYRPSACHEQEVPFQLRRISKRSSPRSSQFGTMDLSSYLSSRRKDQPHLHHSSSVDSTSSKIDRKRYLPLLANPINDNVREVLSSSFSDLEKMNTTSSGTTICAGNGRTSRGNMIIYKQHHEASTIELFYDLFFVANLGMEKRHLGEVYH